MSAAASAVEEVLDLCVSDCAWCGPARPSPALRWFILTLTLGTWATGGHGATFHFIRRTAAAGDQGFWSRVFFTFIALIFTVLGVKAYIEVKMEEFECIALAIDQSF